MQRHGIRTDDLGRVAALLPGVRFEGWTIHLPCTPRAAMPKPSALGYAALATAPGTLWFSHLPRRRGPHWPASSVAREAEPVPVRLRVGTRLWLGDKTSRSHHCDGAGHHKVKRGDRAGYRQRVCPASGWIVVVAGGTSHGIGMEAPTSARPCGIGPSPSQRFSRGCWTRAQPVHHQRQENAGSWSRHICSRARSFCRVRNGRHRSGRRSLSSSG
jgi:hypothetical protein